MEEKNPSRKLSNSITNRKIYLNKDNSTFKLKLDNNSFEINSLINEKDDLTHRINEIENVKNALKSENGQLKQENEGGNI